MCVGPLSEQLKKKAGKDTQLKCYKVMSILTLMCGSAKSVLTNRIYKVQTRRKCGSLDAVKGHTRRDKLFNHDVRSELGTYQLIEEMQANETNCF
jgi:flagellar motor component MotA